MSGKNVLEKSQSDWAVSGRQDVAKSRPESGSKSDTTFIGAGCSIKGEIQLVGQAEVNSLFEGELVSQGTLTIGESAEINGNISAENLRVFGRVAGDILCSSRLELHSGARVTGSITSPRVVMHDGVVFEGDCSMPEGQQSAAKPVAD